jgi:TonB family protein
MGTPAFAKAPARLVWARGFAASLGVHLAAVLFIALLAWVKQRAAPPEVELDMARTLAPPVLSVAPPKAAPAHREWVQSRKGSLAQPQELTESAEAEAQAACPPPCPETTGAYAPAGLAITPPSMIDAIDPDDYPRAAAHQGLQGRVTAELYIDDQGRVRQVRLTQRGEEAFNQWVLEKMRACRFRPALDGQGRPMAVVYRQSFNFQLNN